MSSHNPKEMSIKTLCTLLAAVLVVWALSGVLLFSMQDRGTFGDMFGAVNALFSGLAFASLIYTIFMQRQELRLHRDELQLTRKEIKGQKLQLTMHNDVLRHQNFENTFFQSLRLLQNIVNTMDLGTGIHKVDGRDCVVHFLDCLREQFKKILNNHPSTNHSIALIAEAYENFYKAFGHELSHYFRTLYNIIKLVHTSNVTDKKVYMNLIRAQLSDQELCLLFYNCLSPMGSEKFKPLVEQYALLKNLPPRLLFSDDHKAFYAPSAFGHG